MRHTSLGIRHWALGMLLGLAVAAPTSAPAAGATRAADLQAQVRGTAARVIPAVVNISSTVVVRDQALSEEALPFGMTPPPPRRQYGQGSGVIVTPDGYIITNNHVVADTNTVEVLLADRRQFKGRVVGTDPKSDVAVVKIEASGLPVVPWGDSSHLAVGDFVLAIGNPLGLNQTVTFGIVSAVGRADIGIADYEDFIQTDAPINPGSSGGALVNIKGELVGINTAIASPTGGSIGVGFAVPSNMAKAAMQSLMKAGRVIRGYLGASTQDVNPSLSRLFKLPDVKGVIITDVQPKGPAEAAGLHRGDVVVRFDGKTVIDSGRLQNLIGSAALGSRHRLDIIRDGKPEHLDLVIQEAPRELARRQPPGLRAGPDSHPLGGIVVDELTPAAARQLGIPQRAKGVIVVEVEEGSLADAAGVLPGDLILEVNRQRVPDLPAYQRLVEPIKPRQATLLLISRQGTLIYVPLEGE